MSGEVCRDHDEKESSDDGQDGEEVRIKTDESADGEKGEGMGRSSPGEETLDAILEYKNDADSISSLSG